MTFWERFCCSARTINSDYSSYREHIDPECINEIQIYHETPDKKLHLYTESGSKEAHEFLSRYSSFVEVQKCVKLLGTIDHISCVQAIRRSAYGVDHFTKEEFYQDGCLSMLEKDIIDKAKKQ